MPKVEMRVLSFLFFLILSFSLSSSYSQEQQPQGTVCLNMIVKNETGVLRRCLDSVKPLIDYWVIVDTGSTDGSQDLIKENLKEIPGELYERPWVNFGFNRTEAFELAHNKADFILFIDADDWLEYEEGYAFPTLTKDCYQLWRGNSNFSYLVPQLVRGNLPWKWIGVLHEYLACNISYTSEILHGIKYIQTVEGSRSKDPQKKYESHVEILKEALKEEPQNLRYVFYLAESYRDAGDLKSAMRWYQKRIEMGGWEEEVYWSYLQIAKLKKMVNEDSDTIIEAFYRAHRYRPQRPEALYYLAEYFNQIRKFDLAYATLKSRIYFPPSHDVVFNETWIENWGFLFQLSLAAYYLGSYQESLDACETLLKLELPQNFHDQAEKNRLFCLEKLGPQKKKVLLAILARNKAHVLPTFLKCIENLDYDKKWVTIYIHTNNNEDATQQILEEWIQAHQGQYGEILFESNDLPNMPSTNPHEWSSERWNILARIRNESLKKTLEKDCDFYFTVDCDNFIAPETLRLLIGKDKPIVSPLLRAIPEQGSLYSNFFADVDENGYFKDHPDYYKIFNRELSGTFKVPVVHQAYVIKAEFIPQLSYTNYPSEWEFISFSRCARQQGVDQYICNEREFGSFLHFSKNISLSEEVEAFQKIIVPEFQDNLLEGRIQKGDKRYHTFQMALQLMEERKVKTIVETGTARGGEKNFDGDGGSTILFANWAARHQGFLYSVDIDPEAIEQAKLATLPFQKHVQLLTMDSIKFLQIFPTQIDFLYLDSLDFDIQCPSKSQKHHLMEMEAAYDKLTPQSIVMIDDCKLPYGGKGKEVIAFLLNRGWEILQDGYQVIMTKKKEHSQTDYFSDLLQKAKEKEKTKCPEQEIIASYLRAHHFSYSQAEPLFYLSRYLRTLGRYEEAYQFALEGKKIIHCEKGQPLEKWIYDHGMLWEFSLSAHSTGRFEEALDASQAILDHSSLSDDQRTLLQKNMSYYQAGVQILEFSKQKWGGLPQTLQAPQESHLHVCTIATHDCKELDQLLRSCEAHHIEVDILGMDKPFSFGKKLEWVQEYLQKIPDNDVVLVIDAYDTLVLAHSQTILDQFYAMHAPCVVSTETGCHPFPHLSSHYPSSPTRFKYLNSGSYIGYAGYLKHLFHEISPIPDQTDDQGLLTALYLHNPSQFKLDYECRLFLTLYQVEQDQITLENQTVQSKETGSFPCVIHGNGPGKSLYQHIYNTIFSRVVDSSIVLPCIRPC